MLVGSFDRLDRIASGRWTVVLWLSAGLALCFGSLPPCRPSGRFAGPRGLLSMLHTIGRQHRAEIATQPLAQASPVDGGPHSAPELA